MEILKNLLTLPDRKALKRALLDGLVLGSLVWLATGAYFVSKKPLSLDPEELIRHSYTNKGFELETGPMKSVITWDTFAERVSQTSRIQAKKDLSKNMPNLAMQSLQQQEAWPGLRHLDRG